MCGKKAPRVFNPFPPLVLVSGLALAAPARRHDELLSTRQPHSPHASGGARHSRSPLRAARDPPPTAEANGWCLDDGLTRVFNSTPQGRPLVVRLVAARFVIYVDRIRSVAGRVGPSF